jgi:cytochrome oxidase Cu insertion factor (SCO1/SenC/PrrC family)
MERYSIHQGETVPPRGADGRASSERRTSASTESRGEATRRNPVARLVISGPASGHHLHTFTLPDATGHPVQLWQYRQRSNVLLFFLHGRGCAVCEAFLQALAAQVDAYRQQETARWSPLAPTSLL